MSEMKIEKADRLIKNKETETPITVGGLLSWYAYDIETSLLETGSVKGEYTVIDLYSLAQPFALAEWNRE